MNGGAGSGKSVFITQKLLYKYLKYSKRKCLVVRRIGNSLKDSVFALFKSTISNWNIYNDCKINKTDLTIELPNGSSFIFKGLDDEERLKSIADIDDIWIEEATEIDDFKFDQLCLRLRSKKPYNQVFVSFNPISKENWVYKRWFREDADYNEDTTNVLKTTYKDNRFLPQSYIDNLMDMKRNNPAYFEIYANGEFASLDKLIYTNWKVKTFDYIQILKEVKDSKAIFNLDFGYTNDPTAFGAEILDEVNKRIWIFDGFEEKGLLNDEIAQNIIKMGYGKEVITCDSAEPKSIEELRRNGLSRVRGAVKGKDSIINGINLLQQYEIIVHPKLTWVIEELKNYTWKKGKDGEYINVPIDKYNHSLDSLRYGVTTEIGVKKITLSFFDRSALF
ncbi:MAG: PBSX family phage terminase large subunit [Clostridium sp.]|nr:PBSX family phage terminase large subunit [Clostridium sp.]